MAKKTRAQGSMPALTESELIMVTKMIYRAAKHGQLEMVMGLLRQSREKHLIDEASAKVRMPPSVVVMEMTSRQDHHVKILTWPLRIGAMIWSPVAIWIGSVCPSSVVSPRNPV